MKQMERKAIALCDDAAVLCECGNNENRPVPRLTIHKAHARCQHEDTGCETIIPIWKRCPRRWFRYKTKWIPFSKATHYGRLVHFLVRKHHERYAKRNGYFWLPCPLCGEMMGGHEWKTTQVGITTDRAGIRQGVCEKCAKEIIRRHPKGSVIDVDRCTLKETVTAGVSTR